MIIWIDTFGDVFAKSDLPKIAFFFFFRFFGQTWLWILIWKLDYLKNVSSKNDCPLKISFERRYYVLKSPLNLIKCHLLKRRYSLKLLKIKNASKEQHTIHLKKKNVNVVQLIPARKYCLVKRHFSNNPIFKLRSIQLKIKYILAILALFARDHYFCFSP